MSAIAECFDHILTDHATKGHATLIGAAMREVNDMKIELTRLKLMEQDYHKTMRCIVEADSLLYEFQNNPNIELGEIGHEKISAYFALMNEKE